MDIQKDIIAKLPLNDEQKAQVAKLGSLDDIKRFLSENHIEVPAGMSGIVSGIADKAGAIPEGAGDAVKGVLDSTDIDEKLMGGIKNLGGFGKK